MAAVSPWGKLEARRDGVTGSPFGLFHHLAHHCADVAACFEVIAGLPVVRARLERSAGRSLSAADLARLSVLAFLHDCGKLHPGFQAKAGWPREAWPHGPHGHVAEGATIFGRGAVQERIAANLHVERLLSWSVSTSLLHAVLAHHGRPFQVESRNSANWQSVPALGYDPVAASAEIGALLPCWFPAAFSGDTAPLPDTPDFQHLLCGLVSLADWLGSSRDVFTFVPMLDPAYIDEARRKARMAMAEVGLDAGRWRAAIDGRADFPTLAPGRQPRAAQSLVGGWSLDDPLVILEAETGSGKTEAALWRFARLFEAGKVDSLYFALPTRAAAKQIHGRVNEAIGRLMGEGAPEAVLAVPGYLKVGEVQGQALPGFEVRWDDEDGPGEARRLARWAAESANRYLAATVAIGTVDQAMLAALQVKHAHLRAAALSRALLVIDEVHASDSYMTGVQTHLLSLHLGRGGHAMLMSATLGSLARARWLGGKRAQVPSLAEAIAAPYPTVWGVEEGCRAVEACEGDRGKQVHMSLADGWNGSDAARNAIAAARDGARVLVIRNTVKAALECFEAVMEAGGGDLLWQVAGGPALHHSRFAPEDRKLLDEAVELALSPDREKRPAGGVIIIGTQTLEQSLDICADFLVTDLCPVDVLLQRIGRLHRHADVPRPSGYAAPRCVVLAPANGLDHLAAPAFENGIGSFEREGGGIYTNLHASELTRRLILDRPDWIIPAMNRLLVESATHPDAIEALNQEKGPDWQNYEQKAYGREVSERQAANLVAMPVRRPFAELSFPQDEARIRTRLGGEGAVIRFAEPVPGPFGQAVRSVTLPSHWSMGIDTEEPILPIVILNKIAIIIDNKNFLYDRQGLRRGRHDEQGVQSP
ncbi:MAG: CRISPR-associated helicase Cas3' [Oceanibaculum sp.]